MSTLKAKNIQIGIDVDPNKNFTIKVPSVPNGTLEIRKGNADAPGALLTTINADGGVNTGGPAFSAYNTTALLHPTGTWNKIALSTEEFDTAAAFDASLSRFQPKVAGYYQLNGVVTFGTTTTGICSAAVFKNGVVFKNGTTDTIDATANQVGVSCLVYLNGTTDYAEMFSFQSSSAGLNNQVGADKTYFQGFLARAL